MKNPDTAHSPLRSGWFITHAAVVAVLVTFFAVLAAAGDPAGGANIGAGLTLLPVLVLGLPWTIPVWFGVSTVDTFPPLLWALVNVGPAVLNVALHAWWRLRRARRV